MASIGNDKNGHRRILFVAQDGKRKTVRLGKCSKRDAESVKLRVEALLSASITGSLDRDTSIWLASITESNRALRSKLEAVGLVEPLVPTPVSVAPTLEEHLADFVKRHSPSVKPGTIAVWRQVIANLNELMPQGIRLDEITVGHAKAFHEALKRKGMEPTTIHKRVGFARQFLNDAIDWEVIDKNPFAKIKTSTPSTKSNVEVPTETIEQLMPTLDPTWRIIVALCRFGGLRCPSEVLSLRWSDVDWERSRLSIPEPKVEHHVGRGVRSCPIFSELRPFLEEAWDHASEGAEFVVDKPAYREAANTGDGWKNANLRTQFLKKLRKAGIAPWNRLFHSMRASRQTELERKFPLHVVCAWLGNTETVAKKNYLLVKESDFELAAADSEQRGTECGTPTPKSGTECGTAQSRTEMHREEATPSKSQVKTKKASVLAGLRGGGQGIRTLNRFPGA